MDNNQQLDCIVRFHDVRRLAELERCVFSLVGQRYRPLNIILILQRFSAEEVAATEAALAPLLRLPAAPKLSIHNWDEQGVVDARAFLLNYGLKVAQGRYLAFLDYDDVLFPEAYKLLVSKLHKRNAAIAFASVQVMRVAVHDHYFYTVGPQIPPYSGRRLADLFKSNFCPIHSYVIDRGKIPSGILQFDNSLSIEEDYDFLLRICATNLSDFSLLGTNIGYYIWKMDNSNTVATQAGLDGGKLITYEAVKIKIRTRKETTFVSIPVQSYLGLLNPKPGCSIQDVVNIVSEK